MRNADHSLTQRIARTLGHKNDITTALRLTDNTLYPYIFIDKTQSARVNKLQIYIDVLSPIKILVINSMKFYLLSEKDFESTYKKLDKNLATNENEKSKDKWHPTISSELERKRAIEVQVKRALHKLKKRSQL